MDAPQKIVGQLVFSRGLERFNLNAKRAQARHHVTNRAVLPGRVHPLQDNQQGTLVFGIKKVLQLHQFVELLAQEILGFFGRLVRACVVGIDFL